MDFKHPGKRLYTYYVAKSMRTPVHHTLMCSYPLTAATKIIAHNCIGCLAVAFECVLALRKTLFQQDSAPVHKA